MSAHDHREYVEGCFRCDLSRDESRHNHLTRDIKGDGSCPGCNDIIFGSVEPRDCWLNEDCIGGYHMGEIECRFPTWADDAAEGDYDSMIERARSDPSFRDGLLAAASICRAQGTDALLPPCPSDMAAVYITSVAFGKQP